MLRTAEIGAFGQADAVILKELRRIFQFEATYVKPGQVGGFHFAECDAGNMLVDKLVNEFIVAA